MLADPSHFTFLPLYQIARLDRTDTNDSHDKSMKQILHAIVSGFLWSFIIIFYSWIRTFIFKRERKNDHFQMTFLIGNVAGADHMYGNALLITLSLLSNQTTYHHYLNYRSSELNVIKHYFQSRIQPFDSQPLY